MLEILERCFESARFNECVVGGGGGGGDEVVMSVSVVTKNYR